MQSVNQMNDQKDNELKKKILDEMVVNHADALDRNFDLTKKFIRIKKEGKIHILYKDKLSGMDQILLYFIGKLYAKRAEISDTDAVGNKELMNELGFPEGSLYPWIKQLKDENKIKQVKRGYHIIPINLVEKTIKTIEGKIEKSV